MVQWTSQTKKIIDSVSVTQKTYDAKMKASGGFDNFVKSLGGVFAKWHGITTKPKTADEFRERDEYVHGLMYIFRFCYWNGKTWWYWLNSATKSFYSSKQTKSCKSGTIQQLCTGESGRTRITNCNYGVDTLCKSLGYNVWSCGYEKMISAGATKITDMSQLRTGDLIQFFSTTISKSNWKHVAIVNCIEDGKIYLSDFGSRFIKTGKPIHEFPSEYTNYKKWLGVRFMDELEEEKKGVVPILNGIDIASYQAGIDLLKVPGDFVIVKATEGTTYINPEFKKQCEGAKKAGKLLGVYHYSNGYSAEKEADFFIDTVKDYIGSAILVLDWESGSNSSFGKDDVNYCKKWLDRVRDKTKVSPLIYMSQSVCNLHDWKPVAIDYGLWVARYDSYIAVKGYQNTDSYGFTGAWLYPAIYQYTSQGYLSGYTKNLDLDIAYMDKAAWGKYAKGSAEEDVKMPNTVKKGDKGTDVYVIQSICRVYYVGKTKYTLKLDGVFGQKTATAVGYWQTKHGLKSDMVVGPKTWKAMWESL